MKDIYDLTLGVISDYLKKDSFSVPELEDSIHNIGAPMRVAPAYTVKDYLFELQNDGIIKFRPSLNQFHKVVRINNNYPIFNPSIKF